MLNKKHKQIAIVLIALLALFFLYRYLMAPAVQTAQDIKVIESEKAVLGSINRSANLIGTIKAENSTIFTAKENGILEVIMFSGAQANKGDLIAKIINQEVEKHYTLSLSAEDIAKKQLSRAQRLFKSSTYSKQTLEDSINNQITASKALANSKIDLDKLCFYAPFDGIVGSYKVQNKAQLEIGKQVVSFYNPDKLKVEFDVPLSIIEYINNGQNLSILGTNYKLTYIQKMLDESTHMSPAFSYIICKNCIIGSNVDIDLTLEYKSDIIIVPFEAIFLHDGEFSIYVIENNKTVLRSVKQGLRQKDQVEIISGLQVGEEFISRNPARLRPSTTVKSKE